MFIKYCNNIYNLDNFHSIIRSGSSSSSSSSSISLTKDGGDYAHLVFDNNDIREYILNEIWIEIKKDTKCFDIDMKLILYNDTKKYNL